MLPTFSESTRDLLQASSSERLSHAFKDTKIVQCYTQTPNLLKTLSSSRFTTTTPDENCIKGVFHCTNKRCLICAKNYLQECQSFVASNGSIWRTKCHITCNSLNVIYFLKCNCCHEVTKLGKTDNLRERTNNHISGCRNGKGTDVFDNHVFNCYRSKGLPPSEPFFLLFCLMACNDYHKLLNIERKLHLKGHDTVFKLLWHFLDIFHLQYGSDYFLVKFYLLVTCPVERKSFDMLFLNNNFNDFKF